MPVFPFLVSVRSGLLAGLEFRAISEISGSGLFWSGPPRCGCDRTAIRPFSAIGQKVLLSECASCTGLVLGELVVQDLGLVSGVWKADANPTLPEAFVLLVWCFIGAFINFI